MKDSDSRRDHSIVVRGASENNLRSVDIDIPRQKFVVVSGPSGSGKSTLVFDTIYAEAQRRYMESVSVYARQFFEKVRRPEVDSIEGLTPAVAIDQKNLAASSRSTIGTLTDIHSYLRVLFAREGTLYCETHNREIESNSPQKIVDFILDLEHGKKVVLLAPVAVKTRVSLDSLLEQLVQQGFVRVRVDGEQYELTPDLKVEQGEQHDVDVVVDRIVVKPGLSSRLTDSVESCLALGKGFIRVLVYEDEGEEERLFSEGLACPECMKHFPKLEPSLFSFNSPRGACEKCQGLGYRVSVQGGDSDEPAKEKRKTCTSCKGARLRPEALAVRFFDKSIVEITDLKIDEALQFFREIELKSEVSYLMDSLVSLISARLDFLSHSGLGYLTLSRTTDTLSGGEGQRIRLSRQMGAELTGVLFAVDEPTMGLHPHDAVNVLGALRQLVEAGNSLVVVEHSRIAMMQADYLIEMGPGAGVAGGELVAFGEVDTIIQSSTKTGRYLAGDFSVYARDSKRKADRGFLSLRGASHNNLQKLDVDIPIQNLVGICGVSGAGKSSLVIETLFPAAQLQLSTNSKAEPGKHKEIQGLENFDRVISIDQKPIGRSPRSTPATFTGVFDLIRELFAKLPESKVRGYGASRFSFNVKGGRCETCGGAGSIAHEIQFMSEVVVECSSCDGRRYNRDTLEIEYRGMSVADVLDLTVDEAREIFQRIPALEVKARVLSEVGLGYLTLGQAGPTLSGGEAQRIKLAVELAKKQSGSTLYLLDEPTSGLHPVDVDVLMRVLHRLVDGGNTVVVIDHNVDVLSSCDWLIELGPKGGPEGGQILATGQPQDFVANKKSRLGPHMR